MSTTFSEPVPLSSTARNPAFWTAATNGQGVSPRLELMKNSPTTSSEPSVRANSITRLSRSTPRLLGEKWLDGR